MLEKIISYLAEQVELDPENLSAETTFESLDLDSLDLVEMLVELDLVVDHVSIFRIVVSVYEIVAPASGDICIPLGIV